MTIILESIQKKILNQPFVTAEAHKFGGVEFRLNKREIGHIHGDDSLPHVEGTFAALKDKGLKITNYTEKDGAGKPMKRNRWA